MTRPTSSLPVLLKSFLNFPPLYNLFQDLVRGPKFYKEYVRDYIQPFPGCRLLDIGCGPAVLLPHLPQDCSYVGLDSHAGYIRSAQSRFGKRGEFLCETIESHTPASFGTFDRVVATGVLHHLSDESALQLLKKALTYVKLEGRLITVDGSFCERQSPIARTLLRLDRGNYVRRAPAYGALAEQVFGRVVSSTRHDLFRFPYTCQVMVALPSPPAAFVAVENREAAPQTRES